VAHDGPRPGRASARAARAERGDGDALLEAIRITNDSGGASPGGRTQRTGTAVVLLSDGENNAGQTEPLEAARVARERGIRVYTVALGGGRAPASSPLGIVQPVDWATLARIARRTGGTAFSSATPERLASIYQALGSKLGLVRRDVEVTHVAAGVAAVLLVGATMTSFARRPALP
jgi:Ca-activated chloride channel family protein